MGRRPGPDGGAGEGPDRGPGMPDDGRRWPSPVARSRLARFAGDGRDGAPAPSGELALLADELSGPQRRCPGATDNELIGLLRAWAALESWAASAKLGVIRGADPPRRRPVAWRRVTGTCRRRGRRRCAMSWPARWPAHPVGGDDRVAGLGAAGAPARYRGPAGRRHPDLRQGPRGHRDVQVPDGRRRGHGRGNDRGPARGKTYPQVLRLAEQAALTVDPELAERRREQTQKKDARVSLLPRAAGHRGACPAVTCRPMRRWPRWPACNARARGVQGVGRVRRHPDGRAARLRLPRPAQRREPRGQDRLRRGARRGRRSCRGTGLGRGERGQEQRLGTGRERDTGQPRICRRNRRRRRRRDRGGGRGCDRIHKRDRRGEQATPSPDADAPDSVTTGPAAVNSRTRATARAMTATALLARRRLRRSRPDGGNGPGGHGAHAGSAAAAALRPLPTRR